MNEQEKKHVCIIGTAYPLRGGLAAYNERLAREFEAMGHRVTVITFKVQYPNFLFPGKSQYSTSPPPKDLDIKVSINSVNPFNWIMVGRALRKLDPDLIVVKFWLPFMGPCFGTILRVARRKKKSSRREPAVVCIADNIIPHEGRPFDRAFTKYFIKTCDGFITMSDKVERDLRTFDGKMPSQRVEHPLYDHFGGRISPKEAWAHLGLPAEGRVALFFGFIRKYKGLDLLFEAIALLKLRPGFEMPRFLIAGEFYEDQGPYDALIDRLGIRDNLVLRTDFIPDEEVRYFLCAADVLIQPYRHATQSGVTPLAYHFEVPMVVTTVGGLPDLVPDGRVGLHCAPSAEGIADAVERYYFIGREHFLPYLREEKKKYSWRVLADTILRYIAE